MRRLALLTMGFALALSGVAVAAALHKAVSYKAGIYTAGNQSDGDGVKLRIRHGSFSVSRISFQETCTTEGDSFSDQFTFVKGSAAKLKGTINRKGRLSGQYTTDEGSVTVTGHVKGHKATVKGSESTQYTPSGSTAVYDCEGSKTFKAKRLVISTRGGG